MSETGAENHQASGLDPADPGLRARVIQGLRSVPSGIAGSAVATSIAVAFNQILLQMGISLPPGPMLPSDWAPVVQALGVAGQGTTNVGLNLVANWLWDRAN